MKPCISTVAKKGASSCSHFAGCNAPICPLDDWQRAQHLPGERVCLWLREVVKPGGMARIAHAATHEIAAAVAKAFAAILIASGVDLQHKLAEASRSGSKLAKMRAARDCMAQMATAAFPPASSPAAAHAASRSVSIEDDHGRR